MVSILGLMGAMMALGGSVGLFVFPVGLNMGIKKFVNLAENGMVYPLYIKPPVSPTSTFYLYSIKNPKQALLGKKPSFTLKGPYVFNVAMLRERVKFSNDKERLSFDWSRRLMWNDANSSDPNEKMWLLNPILPTTLVIIKSLILDRIPFKRISEPVVFNSANLLLDNYKERLFIRTTPRRLMDGRKVEMLSDLVGLATRVGLKSLLPPGPPDNVFGLVYVQNRTIDQMEVWTGLGKTPQKYAEVNKFKGRERVEAWRGRCGTISGTNGELYKPFLDANKPVRVFLGPVCRSFDLEPTSSELVRTGSGIMGIEYQIGGRLFQGSRNNPGNKCFCQDVRSYDCQYDGLINMGPCFFEAPLFFARVNFEGADPKIANLVDLTSAQQLNGSAPDWKLPTGQTFRVEPITGTALEVEINLMATFKVPRQPYMRDLANVQNITYMPLFVTSEQLSLPLRLVWQVYFLQKFNDYHKPIMAGTALAGMGVMALKFLF